MIEPFGPLVAEWRQLIIFLSIASMVLGAVAAIAQESIKRLMAYSSIGHIGYALIGLATGTANGIRGVLVYMAIYLVMTVGTFAVILCMRRNGRMLEGISDLAGLSRTQPALALALGIFMFALSGIPPTAGFFAKLYVFFAAIDAKLAGLAVIGVVTSVVSAFYYLRVVKVMYFDEPVGAFDRPLTAELKGVLFVTAVVTLFFFILPGPIVGGAEAAALALFSPMTARRPRLPPGYRLLCYNSIGSTNDEAKRLASDGAEEGTAGLGARADAPVAGGAGAPGSRRNGNLYVSLILRPDCPVSSVAQLGFVAAVAVGEALRADTCGRIERLAYKWPNDVLIERP